MLPTKVIDSINRLEPADRGIVFTAVFNYINHGYTPDPVRMSPVAMAVFELVQMILEPKLRRRSLARKRKASMEEAVPESVAPADVKEYKDFRYNISRYPTFKNLIINVCRKYSDPEIRDALILPELRRRAGNFMDIAYYPDGSVELLSQKYEDYIEKDVENDSPS